MNTIHTFETRRTQRTRSNVRELINNIIRFLTQHTSGYLFCFNNLISPCSPLLRVIPVVAFTLIITTSAQAAPDFSKAEKLALLEYARSCLIAQLAGISAPTPPEFSTHRQRACFVTFFNGKRVFACFGGFSPRRANLAEEINENIRLALKNDARARSTTRETAQQAGVQITFPLGQPELVTNYQEIDPAREGMFVESANAGVAFVPGEARTANWAFRAALRRLGEYAPSAVAVYRFKAEAISTRDQH